MNLTQTTDSPSAGIPETGAIASAPQRAASDDLANQETFLKLLVAQMQNQNPLSPADPIQFLSQLAQFSSLEQTIAMRQRLDAIHEAMLTPLAPAIPAGPGGA